MKTYILKITALSPLNLGMGKADVIVDCDTTQDEYGMPYFPAKRFKGMLYESALEMAEISGEAWFTEVQIKELFGQSASGLAGFSVDNLYLADYRNKRAGWEYLFKQYTGLFNKSYVLDNYTELRYQTAIDENGTAADGSLRNIRLVDKDTVFTGNLELHEDNEINRKILDYACRNLRFVGAKRNRGCGHVSCQLLEGGNK